MRGLWSPCLRLRTVWGRGGRASPLFSPSSDGTRLRVASGPMKPGVLRQAEEERRTGAEGTGFPMEKRQAFVGEEKTTRHSRRNVGTMSSEENKRPSAFTPAARQVLDRMQNLARTNGQSFVGVEHLLLSILTTNSSAVNRYLEGLHVDVKELISELASAVSAAGEGGAPVSVGGPPPLPPRLGEGGAPPGRGPGEELGFW